MSILWHLKTHMRLGIKGCIGKHMYLATVVSATLGLLKLMTKVPNG